MLVPPPLHLVAPTTTEVRRCACAAHAHIEHGRSGPLDSSHTTPLIVVKEEPREADLPLDASHLEHCQPMTKMTQRLLDSIMENAYVKFTIDTSERIPPNGSAGASRMAQRAARYEPYLAARRTKLYREQMARGRDAPPPAHADDPAGGFLQPQPTSALRSRLLSVDPPSSPCSLAPNSRPSTACSTPPPVTPPPACHPSLALQAQHVASPPSRASLSTVTGHPCAPSNPSQLHELHWVPCIVSPDGALRRVHNLRRLADQSPHEHLAQFQPMENPNSLTAADQPPGNASYVRLVQQPMCKPRPPAPAHHPGLAVRQDYVSREQFVRPVAQQSLARSPQVSMTSNPNPGQPPPPQPSPPNDRPSRSRKRPRRSNYPRLPRRRLPGLPGELVIIQEYPCSTDNIPCQSSTSSRAVVHPRPTPASKSSM